MRPDAGSPSSRSPTVNTIPGRVSSSTTRSSCSTPSRHVPVASSPKSRSSASRASESRTSARRSCSGIEPRACPSPTRSSGRTLARPIAARTLVAGGAEELVRARTGLPIQPYFSATKLGWLLDALPGARERAERGELAAGTIECWLAWRLSGGPAGGAHISDVTNASRTLLFDTEALDWSDELLDLFEVPRPLLPEVVPTWRAAGSPPRRGTAPWVLPCRCSR